MQTTLAGSLSAGETGSLTLATNYATQLADVSASRPAILVIDRVDSDGDETPNAREYLKFTGVSSTTISGLTRGMGGSVAQSHAAGAIVELVVDADTIKSITDTFLAEHTSAGAHSSAIVTLTGAQTLTNKTLTSPKVGTSIDDTNGNEIIKTPATASAVNEITATNAATGNAPQVAATGDDANINLDLRGKGNGVTLLEVLRQDDTTNTYKPRTFVISGWGFITASGAIDVEETVTMGITFTASPIVMATSIGYKTTSDPTAISDFNNNMSNAAKIWSASVKGISTTQFVINLRAETGTTLTSGDRIGYSWVAIGQI